MRFLWLLQNFIRWKNAPFIFILSVARWHRLTPNGCKIEGNVFVTKNVIKSDLLPLVLYTEFICCCGYLSHVGFGAHQGDPGRSGNTDSSGSPRALPAGALAPPGRLHLPVLVAGAVPAVVAPVVAVEVPPAVLRADPTKLWAVGEDGVARERGGATASSLAKTSTGCQKKNWPKKNLIWFVEKKNPESLYCTNRPFSWQLHLGHRLHPSTEQGNPESPTRGKHAESPAWQTVGKPSPYCGGQLKKKREQGCHEVRKVKKKRRKPNSKCDNVEQNKPKAPIWGPFSGFYQLNIEQNCLFFLTVFFFKFGFKNVWNWKKKNYFFPLSPSCRPHSSSSSLFCLATTSKETSLW